MLPLSLNRTNDALIKYIFANDQHKHITLDLINAVLEYAKTTLIEDLSFYDRELDPEIDEGKKSYLDVLAQATDGSNINIEVQVSPDKAMGRRTIFYWCRVYERLRSGDQYDDLKRTITINILDFNYFEKEECPNFHNLYGLYNKENHHHLTKDLEIHFIELPKLTRKLSHDLEELKEQVKEMTKLEKWCWYFSNKTTPEQLEVIAMSEPAIQAAINAEYRFKFDRSQWWAYEQAERDRMNRVSEIKNAKNEGMAEGIALGREQGILQGREQGILQGREQGREQGIEIGGIRTSEFIAVKMIKRGYPAAVITEDSGVDLARLKELAIEYGYTLKIDN